MTLKACPAPVPLHHASMVERIRPLCIFHKNCLDGRGAAAVVHRKEPDCEFVAMQYGMKRPPVLGRKLYIVDFGLPIEEMRAVRAEALEVIWIDHHASQQGVHATLGWGVLDTNECGATLTWKVLFPDETMPPILPYIRDKDLWKWELPDSRAIAAGLDLTYTGDNFAGLLDTDINRMAEIGRPTLAALATRVAKAVQSGVEVFEPYGQRGLRALAVPCNRDINDVGEHICLPPSQGGLGYDLAILYYRKHPHGWVHSLRSAGVDCARIAMAFGGGGHPSASSYIARDPFILPQPAPPGGEAPPGEPSSTPTKPSTSTVARPPSTG